MPDCNTVKTVIIFGVDNSSSVHVGGKNKTILFLGEGPAQGLDNATITTEAKYLQKDLCYVIYLYFCTIMETTVSYLLMLQKYIISKQKIQ